MKTLLLILALLITPLAQATNVKMGHITFNGCEIGFDDTRTYDVPEMTNINSISTYAFDDKNLRMKFKFFDGHNGNTSSKKYESLDTYIMVKELFLERRAICSHSPFNG